MLAALGTGCVAGLAGCSQTSDDSGGATDPPTSQATTTATTTSEAEARTDGGESLPPATANWTTGKKYGVGTIADHRADDPSKVWFTLTDGALTEPRFPRIDLLNARHVSFLVTDGDGYVARTHADPGTDDSLARRVEPTESDALAFQQTVTETDDDHDWTLTVEHVADPERDALLLDVTFESASPLSCYVVATPTPSGRASHTRGERRPVNADDDAEGERSDGYGVVAADTGADGIVATDESGDPVVVALALAADGGGFDWATAGEVASQKMAGFLEDGVLPAEETTGEASSEGDGDALAEGAPGAPVEGVLALAGRLADESTSASRTLALGFATDGDAGRALDVATEAVGSGDGVDSGYEAARAGYVDSWRTYLEDVSIPDAVRDDEALADQYRSAAMVLKAVEDKTYVGASIASPSVPWGSAVSAREASDHGYNFVWARDLYQVFTAFDAMGDVESAVDALEYVFAYQHDGDGFLPQNTFVDGRTRWGGEQHDEIAFPLVMADQLRERHGYEFADVDYDYGDVRALASYLVEQGPRTDQERWEEEDGFSPSTIAAEIAGLAAAARLAHAAGREDDALRFLAVADHWQRSVVDWCATTTVVDGVGAHGADAGGINAEETEGDDSTNEAESVPTPYFFRVNDDADPDDGAMRSLANGGPTLDERAVVDAGFLELVRLGVLPWDDPVVRNSLAVVDDAIRVDTPNGPAWYRYNGDGYGEQGPDGTASAGAPWSITHAGKGRLWPILTGERAEYELFAETTDGALAPEALLESMQAFANDGRMIPEQVWDRRESTSYGWEFGEGTASATPLAWSMAQYVRLAHSIDAGAPVETPSFVAARYADGGPPSPPSLDVSWPEGVVDGEEVTISGSTSAERVLVGRRQEWLWTEPSDGSFTVTVPLSVGRNALSVVAVGDGSFPDVGLAARQRTISSVD